MGKRTRSKSREVDGRKRPNESLREFAKRTGGRVPKSKQA